jgi:IS1 family transposase
MIECDELSSFVARKSNRQWVWLALDRSTREIVGCFVGARNESGAQGLWDSLPTCYLDAECHTDLWAAYQTVVFGNRHHRYGKGTQHIERFNCTLRQRVGRLVRKTLSFSKKLDNHIAAIWLFIHHYNASY